MNHTANLTATQADRKGIQMGDTLTKRDGTTVLGASMTFSPPYWVFENGVATRNYGDDERAAFEDYDSLTAAQWRGQVRQVALSA